MPYRDSKTGKCIVCKPGEIGLLLGLINPKDTARRFEGYSDSTATKKKILSNVINDGDTWFNSGDLLRRDYWGFFYWSDRTGDTFRWKGENVATTEVEGVITSSLYIADVAVYGVKIPNQDGRAGMAAIVLNSLPKNITINHVLDNIINEITKNLPIYARPLFIRFDNELLITGTFKVNNFIKKKKFLIV